MRKVEPETLDPLQTFAGWIMDMKLCLECSATGFEFKVLSLYTHLEAQDPSVSETCGVTLSGLAGYWVPDKRERELLVGQTWSQPCPI